MTYRHPTFLGSNISLVKSHNLRAILLTLLLEGGASRVQLAQRTSLSSTTITNLVSELLESGVVAEEGAQPSKEPRSVGRPRTALWLVPDSRFAIGVHIEVGTARVAISNLYAEVVVERTIEFEVSEPGEQILDRIACLIESIVAESAISGERLLGVGVGASGLVDYRTGVNLLAPNLGWRNLPIRDTLNSRLGLPVVVDNNVRSMALSEALFGAGRGVNVLAYVYGKIGVGAGIVVNGRIYHGSTAGAGEIGHITLVAEGGETCHCGNRGCLETLVSEPALLRQAWRVAQDHPDSRLARLLRQRPHDQALEAVFAAARDGDALAGSLLADQARYLGIALANLVNVLNPELIILGGIFAKGGDLILPAVEETMRQRSFAGLGEGVRLQAASFEDFAGVVGASALALDSFFYQLSESN